MAAPMDSKYYFPLLNVAFDCESNIENDHEPVSFVNEIDRETFPVFTYSSSNIPGPGCREDDFETGFEGCKCVGLCTLNNSCSCINRFGPCYSDTGELLEPVVSENKPLIECGSRCACISTCSHRVVQNGIDVRLQVFKTGMKGFGVRTLEHIPKYKFVCEYSGEVIGKVEACKRAQGNSNTNYIFVLREHGSAVLETIIDPTNIGNVGRFLNHSCSPNLFPLPVRSRTASPQVCLFALCDIAAGDELTYNYSGHYVQEHSPIVIANCFCGSHNCKGTLPYDHSLLQMDK